MQRAQLYSTFATGLLVVTVVYLLFTRNLFGTEPVSITVQVLAVLLMIWARTTLGMRSFHFMANPASDSTLVTIGPYRWVRHPIYAAIWLFTWAGIAVHLTLVTFLIGLAVGVLLLWRMQLEERALRAHFSEYHAYAQTAKRIIPFVY